MISVSRQWSEAPVGSTPSGPRESLLRRLRKQPAGPSCSQEVGLGECPAFLEPTRVDVASVASRSVASASVASVKSEASVASVASKLRVASRLSVWRSGLVASPHRESVGVVLRQSLDRLGSVRSSSRGVDGVSVRACFPQRRVLRGVFGSKQLSAAPRQVLSAAFASLGERAARRVLSRIGQRLAGLK